MIILKILHFSLSEDPKLIKTSLEYYKENDIPYADWSEVPSVSKKQLILMSFIFISDSKSNERDISFPGKITLFNNDSKFLLDEKILINSIGNTELFLKLLIQSSVSGSFVKKLFTLYLLIVIIIFLNLLAVSVLQVYPLHSILMVYHSKCL